MSLPYCKDDELLQNEKIYMNSQITEFSQHNHAAISNKCIPVDWSKFDNNKVSLQIEKSNDDFESSLQVQKVKYVINDNQECISLHNKCYDSIKDTFVDGISNVSTVPEELILIKNDIIDNNKNVKVSDVIDNKNKISHIKNNENLESLQFDQIIDVKNSNEVNAEIYNNGKVFVKNENTKVSFNKLLVTDKYDNNIFSSKQTNSLEIESTDEIINDQIIPINKLNKTKELSLIIPAANIPNISSNNTMCDNIKSQFLLNDETINFSNEKILEITKNLKDRDISLYEQIFFSNDSDEFLEVEQKNVDNTSVLLHNHLEDSGVPLHHDNTNLIINNDTTLHSDMNNKNIIIDEKSFHIEEIPNTLDTSIPENVFVGNDKISCIFINQMNVNTDNTLQFKENSYTKTIDEVCEFTNLVNDKNSKDLTLTVANVNILPKIETVVINTVDPVITDQTISISNKDLIKSKNVENTYPINDTLISDDKKSTNDVIMPLENKKINFQSSITESLDTMDKNISTKETQLITKLQNMNWLKNHSTLDVTNMSHNQKLSLKSFPTKEERNKDYFSAHEDNRKSRFNSSIYNKNQSEIKDSNSSKENNPQQQKIGNQSNPTVSTRVWGNNNAAKELFPKAQSIVIDRSNEAEELSKALAESICTAQQETEKRKFVEASLKINIEDDFDDNHWGKVHKNLPNDPLTEANNSSTDNHAKGFVDKFGRVDGYTEKRLFMGKGARKKEQEFLKAHTENRSRLQDNQTIFQLQSRKLNTESNFQSHQEINKVSNLNQNKEQTEIDKSQHENQTKEEILPNRYPERYLHKKSLEKFNLSECDVSVQKKFTEESNLPKTDFSEIDKNQQKYGFNRKISKDVNQVYKEDILKHNQNLSLKNQDNINKSQDQNYTDRYQECNKNQEYITGHKNYSDKYQENMNKNQEYYNRQQNHSERNRDNINKKHDHLNRNPNYQNIADKQQDYSNKNPNYSDRNYEISKKNQENYRNQNYSNKCQEFTNTQYRFSNHLKNENLDEYQHKKCNLTFQKHCGSSNQIYNSQPIYNYRRPRNQMPETKYLNSFNQNTNSNFQEDKKVNVDKTINASRQIDIKQEKQKTMSKNVLDENLLKVQLLLENSSLSTDELPSDLQKINQSKQNIPILGPCTNFDNIQEISNSESKPNAVMTSEGNQSLQHILDLNKGSCISTQGNDHQMDKNDVPDSETCNSVNSSTCTNTRLDQITPYPQTILCENYDTSIPQMHSGMNVNAPSFNIVNPNVNQGIPDQYSPSVDAIMANSPYGLCPFPNNHIVDQHLRMNEISNSSQKILSLHNTVCDLSKQLASAQANLLAAQVKFCQDAGTCTTNPQNLLVMQVQNQPLPTDFLSTKYNLNYPNFQTPVPSIQKVQSDTYELPNNFHTVNVQNFTPESFHTNTLIDQRLNLHPMYIHQNNLYQQQPANFQQYNSVNDQTGNIIPRGQVVLQNSEENVMRNDGNQFYTH